jgi:hypothetical protein
MHSWSWPVNKSHFLETNSPARNMKFNRRACSCLSSGEVSLHLSEMSFPEHDWLEGLPCPTMFVGLCSEFSKGKTSSKLQTQQMAICHKAETQVDEI